MIFEISYPNRVVLASASPRRKAMLKEAGIECEVIEPRVDEENLQCVDAIQTVEALAKMKAEKVSGKVAKDCWVIGADTVVVLNREIMGKPAGFDQAVAMLEKLSGKEHQVLGGYCIVNRDKEVSIVGSSATVVEFMDLPKRAIENYVYIAKPFDKAGGYGIQEVAGMFVKKISGSYTNVVGLPMAELISALLDLGVIRVRD